MENIVLTPAMVAAMPIITILLFGVRLFPIPEKWVSWFQWFSMMACGPFAVWLAGADDMTIKSIVYSGWIVGGVAVGIFEGAKKAVAETKALVK
jgi:hypothetical protein